ncbi:universal stress protein [Winogradskyella arenosi]|uniref:Nucleotide-binding universal stress UspA family protein n=1 Tax=Winogradskyella arenosi TaxID=533325 RepID=A0A368ZEW9_9FLAO|nr:universal stress protein [Winogradskyella arenosi]RCW92012.1 nucleotide-binding universal stress UspA family protein [Winogradskyella arenosi]
MRQILLPTDFSKNAWNAITYAIQLFKDEACTFHILNVYTPIIYHLEYVVGYPEQFGLVDAVRDTSKRHLEETLTKIRTTLNLYEGHEFKTYSKFDTVHAGIKTAVEDLNIDLIIMGTKGATGAKEVLFGSNTVHLFNAINCPILAIPSQFTFEAPHELLFPTDLELNYEAVPLQVLKHIVEKNHARLNIMHVSTGYELTEKQEQNKATLAAQFKNLAYLYHDIQHNEIPKAINEFQVKHKIDLLVMINNKHSFFENLFFKKTLHQIGFHLNVPFLVLPSAL